MLCDKHVVKMILETCQLLSTAHRVLDGHKNVREYSSLKTKKTCNKIFYDLDNIYMNINVYLPTHINHPSNVWTRQTSGNYRWLYDHLIGLLDEYTYRYQKTHKCERLLEHLMFAPENIKLGPQTTVPLCMPEKYHDLYSIQSYRNYYNGEKLGFAKWTNREKPKWIFK